MTDDLIARLRKAAHIEPEEVAELMEEAADALEAAREDAERLDELELVGRYWSVGGQCYDVREAIDDGRKEARND